MAAGRNEDAEQWVRKLIEHRPDSLWRANAEVEREARIKDDAWMIEMHIPFKEIGLETPEPGGVWGLGVQRWRHEIAETPAFSEYDLWDRQARLGAARTRGHGTSTRSS